MAPIRSLLYPVDPAVDHEDTTLEAAVSAARCFGAYLEVLHAQVSPTAVIAPGTYGISAEAIRDIAAAAENHMAQSVEAVRTRLAGVAERLGVPVVAGPDEAGTGASVALITGERTLRSVAVGLRGRVTDLVLVRQPTEETLASATLEAALKESGRPVLVLPRGVTEIRARRIGVAWNGRVEVARAVGGSLGLLAGAEAVHVLASRQRPEIAPAPEQLGAYLALHGVGASIHRLDAEGGAVADALLGQIDTLGLDLLVAGAYSRSRLRDVIFGSVTRRLLTGAAVPLVVAH